MAKIGQSLSGDRGNSGRIVKTSVAIMKGKRSLKTEISNLVYDEFPDWVNGGRAERLAMELGYKPSNASRRCRELESEGIFERRINRGSVEYRYNEELMPKVVRTSYMGAINALRRGNQNPKERLGNEEFKAKNKI